MAIPQYLLESSFCLIIFYGFYHFFLKRETFFQLNRAYLLSAPFLALAIPLLNISFQKDAPPESIEALFYPAIQSAQHINELLWEQMRAPSPVFSVSIADVIMAIYLMGVLLMSCSLLRGLWQLGKIIRGGKRQKNKEFTVVSTEKDFPAASFFSYLFWNKKMTEEQQLILEHEKVHIRQWHSLDVLLIEICVIIKWFNPLIYWFRAALKATHEYIADQYVVKQKSNIRDYATLLVQQHKLSAPSPLTNTFYSMTAKRLKMMMQQPSSKIKSFKYLLVFPIIASLMLLFSFNLIEEIPQISTGLDNMNTALMDLGDKTVFEIKEPVKTEKTIIPSNVNQSNEYQIHFGEQAYELTDLSSFNTFTKNNLNPAAFFSLLDSPVAFSKYGASIDMEELELLIPYPNSFFFESKEPNSDIIKNSNESDTKYYRIKTNKAKAYKFSEAAIADLKEIIHEGTMLYINAYGKAHVLSTEFILNDATVPSTINDNPIKFHWGKEIFEVYKDRGPLSNVSYLVNKNKFLNIFTQPIDLFQDDQSIKVKNVRFAFFPKMDYSYRTQEELMQMAPLWIHQSSTCCNYTLPSQLKSDSNLEQLKMVFIQFDFGESTSSCFLNLDEAIPRADLISKLESKKTEKTFLTDKFLRWGDIEIDFSQIIEDKVVEIPIEDFKNSLTQIPVVALKRMKLDEKTSFQLQSVFSPNGAETCEIINDPQQPSIFEENNCISEFSDLITEGMYFYIKNLKVEKLPSKFPDVLIKLIDPKRKKINKNDEYTLKWGGIEAPLKPNNSNHNQPVRFETNESKIDQLLAALNQPLLIYKNNQLATDIYSIRFAFLIPKEEGVDEIFQSITLDRNGGNLREKVNITDLMEQVQDARAIIITVNNLDFNTVFIKLDEDKYLPPLTIKDYASELYNFQIITPETGKTILKIDTSLSENKKIVNIYRNPQRYRIIHVPNFKTTQRLIMERDHPDKAFFFPKNEPLLKNRIELPEYNDYEKGNLLVKWGAMKAQPESKNYDLRTFLLNYKKDIQLFNLNKELKIKHIQFTFYNKDEKVGGFSTILPNDVLSRDPFDNASLETSYHINNLIIEVDGQNYYLPQDFLFNIGRKAM